jgi:hypothetical protein
VYVPFVTFLLLFSHSFPPWTMFGAPSQGYGSKGGGSRATISGLLPSPGLKRVYLKVAENSDQDNEGDRHP